MRYIKGCLLWCLIKAKKYPKVSLSLQHAVKTQTGSGGTVQLIFNVGTRWGGYFNV